ncbi:54S ribosomal protein L39, mitochondrial [Allomyces javanicus]|nr:54S ribosomal protein L39, mitochondrial [Allomyces javanicus]
MSRLASLARHAAPCPALRTLHRPATALAARPAAVRHFAAAADRTSNSATTTKSTNTSKPGAPAATANAAAAPDHRAIGHAQQLFTFHALSPGSAFFLPHGTHIVHALMDLMRRQYRRFGYREVISPLLYKRALWQVSGHWENYKDDMFAVLPGNGDHQHDLAAADHAVVAEDTVAAEDRHDGCAHHAHAALAGDESGLYGLKPMNCPGHCLLFKNTRVSHKDLPMRLADFSPLHRNEASGALSGLTRVRRFHQDDAHIFCTRDQIASEIASALRMVDEVYALFGFPAWEYTLATRPDAFLGEAQDWDHAEAALRDVLDNLPANKEAVEAGKARVWREAAGDGAFYGPKIDVRVKDAAGRSHQTATIQLDFQLPRRFELTYERADNSVDTPVIVHRAVLGSVERMFAILAEHYHGKWPFWLSPRQVMVVPVHEGTELVAYANKIKRILAMQDHVDPVATPWHADAHVASHTSRSRRAPIAVDVDVSGHTLNRKIRQAQQNAWNYVVVVGDREMAEGKVNLRASWENQREAAFARLELFPAVGRAGAERAVPLAALPDVLEMLGEPLVEAALRGKA